MFRWSKNKATASRKPARSSFRPTLEHLETRVVPTASGSGLLIQSGGTTLAAPPPYVPPTPILLVSGTLYLSGDENATYAVVTLDTHNTSSTLDDQVVATINSGNQNYTQRFARSAVLDIVFQGNGGK